MLPIGSPDPSAPGVKVAADAKSTDTVNIDLPVLATAFGQRLHQADIPVTPAQSEQYARSLQLTKPRSRAALYYTTRAIFCTGAEQLETFNRVYVEIFGPCEATLTDESDVAVARAPAPSYV